MEQTELKRKLVAYLIDKEILNFSGIRFYDNKLGINVSKENSIIVIHALYEIGFNCLGFDNFGINMEIETEELEKQLKEETNEE